MNARAPGAPMPISSGLEAAWQCLAAVEDPEIPGLSVLDLGLVRSLEPRAGGGVRASVSPTYTGCPATEVISTQIVQALESAGFGPVELHQALAPAWSTDWISAEGRRKLAALGIAPPVPTAPACPRCGSADTERLSAFGSTPCKALHRCRNCHEPFEAFKCL